ncbi:hypothetical protein HHK36_017751 [Tetracentron sinense]|uniref:Uncharacterized protein n=1 Tax=Tetracentron sinense TaxID=13715 RepID=A0A835D9Q0_TETSI|nr:hypothetical protein HHK36_017751 [Tetracentron sinense]
MAQTMASSDRIDPFLLLDNSYDMSGQVGMGDVFLGGGNMGAEGELYLPSLESISIEENSTTDKNTKNNHFNNINVINSSSNCNNYHEGENIGHWIVKLVEADKTIKTWKEDENATPETHPLNFNPPKELR